MCYGGAEARGLYPLLQPLPSSSNHDRARASALPLRIRRNQWPPVPGPVGPAALRLDTMHAVAYHLRLPAVKAGAGLPDDRRITHGKRGNRMTRKATASGCIKGIHYTVDPDVHGRRVLEIATGSSTIKLAHTITRLARMKDDLQKELIDWGYAVCDAAIRKHYNPSLTRPKDFPYPIGVG